MSLFERITEPLIEDKTPANWNAEKALAVTVKELVDKALVIARKYGRREGTGDWKALWHTLKRASKDAKSIQRVSMVGKKITRKASMSFRSYTSPGTKKKSYRFPT